MPQHLLVGTEDVEAVAVDGQVEARAGRDRRLTLDLDGHGAPAIERDVDVGLAAEMLGELDLAGENPGAGLGGDEVLGPDAEGDGAAGLRRRREFGCR